MNSVCDTVSHLVQKAKTQDPFRFFWICSFFFKRLFFVLRIPCCICNSFKHFILVFWTQARYFNLNLSLSFDLSDFTVFFGNSIMHSSG